MSTIESQTAKTILQEPTSIELGGRKYEVAPPSIATLILVSREISTLPKQEMTEDKLLQETLGIAKDCEAIGNIVATLILGAKGCKPRTREIKRKKEVRLLKGWIHFKRSVRETEQYDPKTELAQEIMENAEPREIQNGIARILNQMQLGDFFGLTTFLLEINLTRATKVEN